MDGFLVIDKPRGISSREAVNRVQAVVPKGVRIGHTGTLDPLATGVLVLALGQATRLTDSVQQLTKEYLAVVRLGATSATDDAEGPITPTGAAIPDRDAIERVLQKFIGEVSQTPPAFSAAHVDGRRAYKLARKGRPVELEPKTVRIDAIEITGVRAEQVELTVTCGKGTYIRSIARDLGKELGCGAFLTSLRRTRVGPFHESHALPLEPTPGAPEVAAALRPMIDALNVPRLLLPDDVIHRLELGQTPNIDPAIAADIEETAIIDSTGRLRAIATITAGRLRSSKVFKKGSGVVFLG